MAGLRAGVPWGTLVRMGLQQLVAMLEASPEPFVEMR